MHGSADRKARKYECGVAGEVVAQKLGALSGGASWIAKDPPRDLFHPYALWSLEGADFGS
jgi:hypothetical protein